MSKSARVESVRRGLLSVVIAAALAATSPAQDRWAPGGEWANWRKIHALQSYLHFEEQPQVDLASACRDEDPLVRAAACMALGRLANADHLPLLVTLLDDESESVRRFALAALLQVEGPKIKEPLLKVVGTWEELHPSLVFHFHSSLGLSRVGLAHKLTSSRLEQRQAWLVGPEGASWAPSRYSSDDGRTQVWMSLPKSEIDADEKLTVQFRITRRGGKQPRQTYPDGERVFLEPISERGEVKSGGGDVTRTGFDSPTARGERRFAVTLPTDGHQDFELTVSSREKLLPGIYVLHVQSADWPLLIRVRRSRADQDQIATLIGQLPDPAAVKTLGEQRALAAVPKLLDTFIANAGKNNFAVAKALARIGDPAAIPVLLKHPHMVDDDLLGNTERELASFGPAADPHFEKLIVNWRRVRAGSEAESLPIALKLLGQRGSTEVDRERLALVHHLAPVVTLDARGSNTDLFTLRAGIWACAPAHPREVTDEIWITRDRPRVFDILLREFDSVAEMRKAKPILVELYQRSRRPGGENAPRDHLNQLIATVAPELAGKPAVTQPVPRSKPNP